MENTPKNTTNSDLDKAVKPTVSEIQHLIGKMLDYEQEANKRGVELSSGRFRMMTTSERELLRAELIADYIRLSAGNTGRTPTFFTHSLDSFTDKICDMSIPSHELLGTYLAAVTVAREDNLNEKIEGFDKLIEETMVHVLEMCSQKIAERSETQTEHKTDKASKTQAA